MIRGDRVVLRPFREEEFEAWYGARLASAGDTTVNPAGPPDPEVLRARLERSGVLHDGWLDLAIELDGRLVGEVGFYGETGRPVPPGVYFFGIGLFDPADRGHGIGTEATRLLSEWLFRETDAVRIETGTALTNTAMRRVFERLGWRQEGTEVRWGIEWAVYVLEPPESSPSSA